MGEASFFSIGVKETFLVFSLLDVPSHRGQTLCHFKLLSFVAESIGPWEFVLLPLRLTVSDDKWHSR